MFAPAIAAGVLVASAAAHAAPDGAAVFQKTCAMCHALDPAPGKMGPPLRGVVGRKAASVQGYAYSDALKRLGGRWTPHALDGFLAQPTRVAPGTRMPVNVPDPAARAALIRYLQHEGATRQAAAAAQVSSGR